MHALVPSARDRPLRILCLGAHADDIEIGCGGTLLQLLTGVPSTTCTWVVFSATDAREREARHSASLYLGSDTTHVVQVLRFRDGYFPYEGDQIKDVFEEFKRRPAPDLVFTHFRDDRHQDHRIISDLTWNTFRDHWILEYEIPKFDGDLGRPNIFVPLREEIRRQKVTNLMAAFGSQRDKRWFTPETFDGLLRLRGIECVAPDGYAEAFYGRKTTLQL